MADILVRNVSTQTKERLRQRAKRRGKSLEADLRETLDGIARAEARPASGRRQGFGSWLVSLSRPGANLSRALSKIRATPPRIVDFE